MAHGHICLVGAALCRNWPLVQRLAGRHGLTLLRTTAAHDCQVAAMADMVAIDCGQVGTDASRALVQSLRRATDAPIVVLDGGLQAAEVAQLLSDGARDYFAEPFNIPLIAERLEHLADARRSRREHPEEA
jgi:CheY-like chemotaxis protein